jgi:hypothetical protein
MGGVVGIATPYALFGTITGSTNKMARGMNLQGMMLKFVAALSLPGLQEMIGPRMGTPAMLSAAGREKDGAKRAARGPVPNYPQLGDITHLTGIRVDRLSSPEA